MNSGSTGEAFPLGHRQPIIPPLGAVFLVNSSATAIDEWLRRAPDDSPDRRGFYLDRLEKVRECGYSLLASGPELLGRQQAALSAFESTDRLPRHERAVQQAVAELTALFCPEVSPGRLHDLESIVVPIPAGADRPAMAIRICGMPASVPTEQIESWIHRLKQVAAVAGTAMTRGVRNHDAGP